jgi:hypothetical protein
VGPGDHSTATQRAQSLAELARKLKLIVQITPKVGVEKVDDQVLIWRQIASSAFRMSQAAQSRLYMLCLFALLLTIGNSATAQTTCIACSRSLDTFGAPCCPLSFVYRFLLHDAVIEAQAVTMDATVASAAEARKESLAPLSDASGTPQGSIQAGTVCSSTCLVGVTAGYAQLRFALDHVQVTCCQLSSSAVATATASDCITCTRQ